MIHNILSQFHSKIKVFFEFLQSLLWLILGDNKEIPRLGDFFIGLIYVDIEGTHNNLFFRTAIRSDFKVTLSLRAH